MAIMTWIMIIIFFIASALGINVSPSDPGDPGEVVEVENPVSYLQLSIYYEDGSYRSMCAFLETPDSVNVEYVGEVKKVGIFDLSVMNSITQALEESGLKELDGRNEYTDDGFTSASLYVNYTDDTYTGASFSGAIPEEFMAGYEKMDAFFASLTADLPVYVPQPMITGNVDEDLLAEINTLLEAAAIENADAYMITEVPVDSKDTFVSYISLESIDGIVSAAKFDALMMTEPFAISFVKLDASADASAICKDFADHVDFYAWVCVLADNALIAQKGDQVLCLIGAEGLYDQFAEAIAACGWTEVETLKR